MKVSKFAKLLEVEYKWPDETEWKYGKIIYTNITCHELAALVCGVSDEDVVIYVDSLNKKIVADNFDGIRFRIV